MLNLLLGYKVDEVREIAASSFGHACDVSK